MSAKKENTIPIGTKALILSKYYYGVLSKSLENIDSERYFSILYFLNENNGCNQQCICNNLAITIIPFFVTTTVKTIRTSK